MTAELCDCFANKGEGVRAILQAVEQVRGRRSVRVWTTRGQFLDVADALAEPLAAAAANWLALATWAARTLPAAHGALLDIGSTTTDIVPLVAGRPAPSTLTDRHPLRAGALVYAGVRRTPLCALMGPPWAGASLAAEFFATTLDVYLILGLVREDASDHDTADGRPATRFHALARLARMQCADADSCDAQELVSLA